jgi:hypothetical protein
MNTHTTYPIDPRLAAMFRLDLRRFVRRRLGR